MDPFQRAGITSQDTVSETSKSPRFGAPTLEAGAGDVEACRGRRFEPLVLGGKTPEEDREMFSFFFWVGGSRRFFCSDVY